MPPVRSARNRKPPPDGFDDIEDTLLEFGNKMKDAENASHEGKKRHEVLWPIFQISHQRKQASFHTWSSKKRRRADNFSLQAQDTFMTCTTIKKPLQDSCTTG